MNNISNIRRLHALTIRKAPVYIIAQPPQPQRRHHHHADTPFRYFGSATYVFVFKNKDLAHRVARDLEAYKDTHGLFPPYPPYPPYPEIHVLPTQSTHPELTLKQVTLTEALGVVAGSGLGLGIVSESFDDVIHIRASRGIRRDWLETLLPPESGPEPEPHPGRVYAAFVTLMHALGALLYELLLACIGV